MLLLLFSIAICVLALVMWRHAYVRWRHEYLGQRLRQWDWPTAEPLLGHAVLSKVRSWSIHNAPRTLDVTRGRHNELAARPTSGAGGGRLFLDALGFSAPARTA
jgi:hypothetical protein